MRRRPRFGVREAEIPRGATAARNVRWQSIMGDILAEKEFVATWCVQLLADYKLSTLCLIVQRSDSVAEVRVP